jgi:GTPase SAR1 family protein
MGPMRLKVTVLGDKGVGKADYIDGICQDVQNPMGDISSHQTESKYVNLGSSLELLFLNSSGLERYGPLRDLFYLNSGAMILIFDLRDRTSYKNIPRLYKEATRVCGSDLPIILCGNHCEVEESERKIKTKRILFHVKKNIPYFEISTKTKYNVDLPLLYIKIWRPQLLVDCVFTFKMENV